VVIFDCNGVLVDSEPLATAIVSQEFVRAGFPLTPDMIARYFTGRRPADMFADVEFATGRKLPTGFAASVADSILRRFRSELCPTHHAAYALSWLRGPKCVASSSSIERIRVSLESTGLIQFFEPNLFSASDVHNGKPAPDLLLHAAGKMGVEPGACIVVEDSPVGVTAGVAAE
jgi:beta-phosphoglucomutase-like phosphatase (HAD superfamily)